MTYAPRVHFRVLIWDGLFVFFKQIFVFLLPARFCIVFNQLSRYVQEKAIIILAKCFLMNYCSMNIQKHFLEKDLLFGILKSEVCCMHYLE